MIDIQLLADEKGIARTYLDATNKLVYISEESRKSLLEILGYPVNDDRALQKILDKEELEEYKLEVPKITLLAHELRKRGMRLPECVLTVKELTAALKTY